MAPWGVLQDLLHSNLDTWLGRGYIIQHERSCSVVTAIDGWTVGEAIVAAEVKRRRQINGESNPGQINNKRREVGPL